MTGSSTSRPPEPWIPETPDNEREVWRTMHAYRDALAMIARRDGIPGLMAELARINDAIQVRSSQALASTVASAPSLLDLSRSLDQLVFRSPRTASPARPPARDPGSPSLPRQSPPLLRSRSGGSGLGESVARRIAMAQVRADLRAERNEQRREPEWDSER